MVSGLLFGCARAQGSVGSLIEGGRIGLSPSFSPEILCSVSRAFWELLLRLVINK